jgi:hypothetical protein
MFANLFKPKWRHSNPEVRARAVARLRTDHPEHSDILRQLLLDDSSTTVRQAALVRVEDPALLLQVLIRESDPELRQRAATVLCDCLAALPEAEQRAWTEQIRDDALRAELVLADSNPEFKQRLLDAMTSQPLLVMLAQRAATAALRRSAALKVDDPELLDQLQRDSRGSDKAVHRIARERLQAYRDAERERAALAQKREQLLAAVEQLVASEDRQQFQARFDLLLRDWQQLPTADAALETEFQRRADQARAIIAQLKAEQARQQAEAQALSQHTEQCEQLAVELEQLLEQARTQLIDATALAACLCRTQGLNDAFPLPRTLTQAITRAEQLQQALQRFDARQEALNSAVSGRDAATLRKQLSRIDWPSGLQRPAALARALSSLAEIEAEQEQTRSRAEQEARALEADLHALEDAIASGEIRVAVRHQDQASEQLRRLNGSAPDSLEQRYKSLCARLQEMKDWQGFAVNGKKEALCEQMEALIDSDLPPQPLADRIRALQKEWKALDATSTVHSQRLWQRFRTAAETAYAPCEQHFAALRQQREQNLRQREEICHQLEQFLEAVDWSNADWPAVERICHTAKREWKQFSPVDRAPGKQVQQRFNQLIRTLDAQLRDWHQGCADAKQALIARASELVDQDDLRAAAEEAKALQRQWKATGPAFRSQERALWQQFRGHCDEIFARLKSDHALDGEPIELADGEAPLRGEALAQFERTSELLDQAEQAVLNGDSGLLGQLLDAISACAAQTAQPWREGLQQRVTLIEASLNASDEIEQQLADSERALRELCIRLEILLGQPSPEEDQAQRMEYQMHRLQQALEEHKQAASRSDILELDLRWHTVAFNGVFPQLRQRFDQLLRRAGC